MYDGLERCCPLRAAGAKPAQAFAKRNVDIHRHGRGRIQRFQTLGLKVRTCLGVERCRGGIARVAGYTGVEKAKAAQVCNMFHAPVLSDRRAGFVAPDQLAQKNLAKLIYETGRYFGNPVG